MPDKILVAVLRSPTRSMADARAVLVSDDDVVVEETVRVIRERLGPGEEFERALNPGPRLVEEAAYAGYSGGGPHDRLR